MSQHDADSRRPRAGTDGERYRLVTEVAEAYRRAHRPGGTEGVLGALERLETHLRPAVRRAAPGPPPRRVATAMVLALHGQPHLAATYAGAERGGTVAIAEGRSWPVEMGLVVANELIERSLAVSQWEIDDLREEVDRRAGRDLKQARALQWMWSHFGLEEDASPWALFRVLFPGVGSRVGEVELVRRGAQLYALIGDDTRPTQDYARPTSESRHLGARRPGSPGERTPPLASLFLPWLRSDLERDLFPLTTFRSRSVDKGLRHALARSIGADHAEVDHLLESMVCLIPARDAAEFLTHDRWRSGGLGSLTGLGVPYTDAVWLTEAPRDSELFWRRWLEREGRTLRVQDEPRMLLDTLAAPRVQAMMRQIYAAILAGLHPQRRDPTRLGAADLELFDVGRHLDAVLQPLLAWPRNPDVHQQLAASFDMPVEPVAECLLELADAWQVQVSSTWLALPGPDRPHTVHGILLQHLVALHASLRRLVWEIPDPRWDHRPVLLLFAGHYLREARLERLWLKGLSDSVIDEDSPVPPPEDVVGTWFWGCWARLLDAMDAEAQSTFSNLSLG